MAQLLRHCLEIVIATTGKVDLELVLEMVQTLPQSLNEAEDGQRLGRPLRSLELLAEAEQKLGRVRVHDLKMARRYLTWEWPTLNDRTRSSIAITLSVFLQKFLSFPLRDLFAGELTISPDHILNGGILVVKLNIPEHEIVSKFAGVIWKYAIQRAIERRKELVTQPIETVRHIFIAVDEAQFWAAKSDQLFQTTARSTRGLTVYGTQNISNLYGELAHDSAGRARVDSMLGNLQNRFFCQNLQAETNVWASESIGKVIVRRINAGSGTGATATSSMGGGSSSSSINYNQGWAEQLDYDVQPRAFTGLRRGGDPKRTLEAAASANGNEKKKGHVEAIMVLAGRRFGANGERWLRVIFDQGQPPPLWMMWVNRKQWAYIPRSLLLQRSTLWGNFLDSEKLTLDGLLRVRRRLMASRKAEADE